MDNNVRGDQEPEISRLDSSDNGLSSWSTSHSLQPSSANTSHDSRDKPLSHFSNTTDKSRRKKLISGVSNLLKGFVKSKMSNGISTGSLSRSDKSNNAKQKSYDSLRNMQTSASYSHDLQDPDNAQFHFKGRVPGLVGLKNHGNTCYMSAVLQCLGHTELLMEYLITDLYKQDLLTINGNSRKFGTKGELTVSLAKLLKNIWTGQYSPSHSSEFKNLVSKYGQVYRGNEQHDAQEFLLWLLDKIHEDLNVAIKKKSKPVKSTNGITNDQKLAEEAIALITRLNYSYVYDIFQALYRSSLICPRCGKQSNTFDPYLSVSLPLPQSVKKPLFITIVFVNHVHHQVRIGMMLDPFDMVKQLRDAVGTRCNIRSRQIVLTEIYYNGFHRTFSDEQPLSDIHEKDNLYAIEIPETDEEDDSNIISIIFLNQLGNRGRRFGAPYVIQTDRQVSYMELQRGLLIGMTEMLPENGQGVINQKKGVLFRMRVVTGCEEEVQLPTNGDMMPLYLPHVEEALANCLPGTGPVHLKLMLEWDQITKQSVLADCEDCICEDVSVKMTKEKTQQPTVATLEECFQLYTQEEKLDTLVKCSQCGHSQTGTTKSISLWSLPDILVIHLKRFRQMNSVTRTKLDAFIQFPLKDLDLSPYVTPPTGRDSIGANSLSGWSLWRPDRQAPTQPEDFLYDLYGVCNHYGNINGGHYTAFCLHPGTKQWHVFDDQRVELMHHPNESVVTRDAYLLFYQRRASYTRKVTDPHHWLHHVSNIELLSGPTQVTHSQSHEDLLQGSKTFSRNHQHYATTIRTPKKKPGTQVASPGRGSLGPELSQSVRGTRPVSQVQQPTGVAVEGTADVWDKITVSGGKGDGKLVQPTHVQLPKSSPPVGKVSPPTSKVSPPMSKVSPSASKVSPESVLKQPTHVHLPMSPSKQTVKASKESAVYVQPSNQSTANNVKPANQSTAATASQNVGNFKAANQNAVTSPNQNLGNNIKPTNQNTAPSANQNVSNNFKPANQIPVKSAIQNGINSSPILSPDIPASFAPSLIRSPRKSVRKISEPSPAMFSTNRYRPPSSHQQTHPNAGLPPSGMYRSPAIRQNFVHQHYNINTNQVAPTPPMSFDDAKLQFLLGNGVTPSQSNTSTTQNNNEYYPPEPLEQPYGSVPSKFWGMEGMRPVLRRQRTVSLSQTLSPPRPDELVAENGVDKNNESWEQKRALYIQESCV